MGISPLFEWNIEKFPNIENAVGKFQQECLKNKLASFHFGVSRTQSNFISTNDEIFDELFGSSEKT